LKLAYNQPDRPTGEVNFLVPSWAGYLTAKLGSNHFLLQLGNEAEGELDWKAEKS
jgi:hypothetical protein